MGNRTHNKLLWKDQATIATAFQVSSVNMWLTYSSHPLHHAWTVNSHLMMDWFPSICHKAMGCVTLYLLRWMPWCWLQHPAIPARFTRWVDALKHLSWIMIPNDRKWPIIILYPAFWKRWTITSTKKSKSWLDSWLYLSVHCVSFLSLL